MPFNRETAARLAERRLAEWLSTARYADLLGWEESGKQDRRELIADDGKLYQVVTYVLPDGDGRLRLVAAVDDGGWSAVAPLTRDKIMNPDGRLVEPLDRPSGP
ncbi:hypothetical protein [Micromonospora sp. CB01531]|uniref:hypothetical protein n=1 Tax=Micromonospora sp. CB01531 TaxID=1718947 RepID=UPI0009F8D4C8|nr:hypothetical protein [Micromonospora sp. CB01531]